MKARLVVTVAVVALVAGAGMLVGGSGGSVSAGSSVSQTNASAGNGTSMGAQISSFMGATAAEANGSVENGMFAASFNATPPGNRTSVVENRTHVLERRLKRLQTRKAALIANRENMTRAAYVARMGALTGQIESLQAAINQTVQFAERTGANASRLEKLGSEARNLTGPEIARLARNGTVGVGTPGAGPPDGIPGEGKGKGKNKGNGTDQGEGQGNGEKGENNGDDKGNGEKGKNDGDDKGNGDEGKNDGDDNGQGKSGNGNEGGPP